MKKGNKRERERSSAVIIWKSPGTFAMKNLLKKGQSSTILKFFSSREIQSKKKPYCFALQAIYYIFYHWVCSRMSSVVPPVVSGLPKSGQLTSLVSWLMAVVMGAEERGERIGERLTARKCCGPVSGRKHPFSLSCFSSFLSLLLHLFWPLFFITPFPNISFQLSPLFLP